MSAPLQCSARAPAPVPRAFARDVDPILMCVNLQREHIDPGSVHFAPHGRAALRQAARCIAFARALGLRIAHVHTERIDTAGRRTRSRPIPGFEPKAREPVLFKLAPSLFGALEIAQSDELQPLDQVILIGFSFAHDAAAAAFAAAESGVRMLIVADACASPTMAPFEARDVDRVMRAVLAPLVNVITAETLLTAFSMNERSAAS